MDANLTTIVAVIGIGSVLLFSFKGKLSGFLKAKRSEHDNKQNTIKKEVEFDKAVIVEKEKKIKELEVKSKASEDALKTIAKSGNKEVTKILKETNVDKLIAGFDTW